MLDCCSRKSDAMVSNIVSKSIRPYECSVRRLACSVALTTKATTRISPEYANSRPKFKPGNHAFTFLRTPIGVDKVLSLGPTGSRVAQPVPDEGQSHSMMLCNWRRLLLPIHGEVARSAGGADPNPVSESLISAPPHSWGGVGEADGGADPNPSKRRDKPRTT